MLLLPSEIEKHKKEIGPKTLNLKKLLDLGLNVPEFVAIPASTVVQIAQANLPKTAKSPKTFKSPKTSSSSASPDSLTTFSSPKISSALSNLSKTIVKKLPCEKYAVRSSALIEDSHQESFAGQFSTEINVEPPDLPRAIRKVTLQAAQFLKGDLSRFSLIVQKYIEPDFAGVTFTRDPFGGREMVIEYHPGRGEDLVSGQIKPQRSAFYWHQKPTSKLPISKFPALNQQVKNFQKIENHFAAPQDIEWCLKDQKWYFLQTRPITSLSLETYESLKFLDQNLPQNKRFFYAKTEISEIAPQPTPFTFSLLQRIYAKNGPIYKVYQKYGLNYQNLDFLQLIGNELFVDREAEIKTLLPSFSYFKKSAYKPHFASFQSFFTTIRNLFALSFLRRDPVPIFNQTLRQLQASPKLLTFDVVLNHFLKDYQFIFEINFFAGQSLEKLKRALSKESISVPEVITTAAENLLKLKIPQLNEVTEILEKTFKQHHPNRKQNLPQPPPTLIGNSLDIADESPFYKNETFADPSKNFEKWWKNLPNWKRNYLQPLIYSAIFWGRLREMGRWLTVKNISLIRNALLKLAQKHHFKTPKNIYFATLIDFQNQKIDEKKCLERKKDSAKFEKLQFPSRLTDQVEAQLDHQPLGVSSGIATGTLVDLETLKTTKTLKTTTSPKILYVKTLAPELTQYFPQIQGILSEQGGLLSHLALIAREKGLPIIINFRPAQSGRKPENRIKINDRIKINGKTAEITKI